MSDVMDYTSLSSQALMDLCDRYFLTHEEVEAEQKGTPGFQYRKRDYTTYVGAINELTKHGTEIREWARKLLTHPDYDARELGASLLSVLAERRQLGTVEDLVVDELCMLATRPIDYDGKELQAVSAAIGALGKTGNRHSIPTLMKVLLDPSDSDNQSEAAHALGKIVHVTWDETNDLVANALQWLKDNNYQI